MVVIKVLTGSTRPGRFNKQVADWVHQSAKKHLPDHTVELVDIADINLPLLNEPKPPMLGEYEHDHTKAWSKIVDEADGFVVISPEYNHSTSAALKNAFDYLNKEWSYKPISFVSYGSGAGGARAVEHLRGIAGELRMFDLRDQILLPNYWNNLDKHGVFEFDENHAKELSGMLNDLAFWSEKMKAARAEM